MNQLKITNIKMFKNSSIITAFAFFFILSLNAPVTALAAGPSAVNLGSAGNYVILSKTGISTTGATSVVGDLGLSPAAASYITGFALTLPSAGAFSTSALVTGKIYAPGYADPTPANISTAVADMQTAYTDGAGRTNPTATELGAGNIGGLTLAPGLYKWGTGLTIPTDVTLSGSANDVWIFQIAQNLNVSSATKIVLAGGAQASNIFWIVAGQTTIGTTAVFNGNILDQTAIVLNTGATLNGRALAQSAVTLDSNKVTTPGGASVASAPVVTPAPSTTSNTSSSNTSSNTSSSNTSAVSTTQTTTTSTQTPVDAKASLMAQLVVLQSALQSMQSGTTQQAKTISSNLTKGSRSNEVKILQDFLISQNKGPAAQALSTVGSTSFFGDMTRSALAEFQVKAGINPSLGYFGGITRGFIRANY